MRPCFSSVALAAMCDEVRLLCEDALQTQTSEVGRGSAATQREKECPRAKERAAKEQRRVKASPPAVAGTSAVPTRGCGKGATDHTDEGDETGLSG